MIMSVKMFMRFRAKDSQSLSPTMNTPNWKHNSGKCKRTKGMCKGQIVARKQSLKSLLLKLSK
jgi:hypothetical protein